MQYRQSEPGQTILPKICSLNDYIGLKKLAGFILLEPMTKMNALIVGLRLKKDRFVSVWSLFSLL